MSNDREALAKFAFEKPDGRYEVHWPNIWMRVGEGDAGFIVAAPAGNYVNLLVKLAHVWQRDYYLLYVLVESQLDHPVGRYQSPGHLTFEEVVSFCDRYRDFFEQDGRHHFWISSIHNEGTVVYDQHNIIFAYGDLDASARVLEEAGLDEAEVPDPRCMPHLHCYNPQNNDYEKQLFAEWDWLHYDLSPREEADAADG